MSLPKPGTPLTARETEVLRLVAHGLTGGEIAAKLVLSPATVRTHMRRVLARLGATNAANAVALGYERGFLRSIESGGER